MFIYVILHCILCLYAHCYAQVTVTIKRIVPHVKKAMKTFWHSQQDPESKCRSTALVHDAF